MFKFVELLLQTVNLLKTQKRWKQSKGKVQEKREEEFMRYK
jgi:hypothetical protein